MGFFTDDEPDAAPHDERRSRVGWTALGIAIVGVLGLSLIPSPYVIERPGPVFNTLGEVTVKDRAVPLISIPAQKTYPTEGTLSMLTVNVVGNREQQPNWLEVVGSWADPSRAVVPIDAVYPAGETIQQSTEQSTIDMQNSQKDAIAASLAQLGYPLDSTLTIAAFSPGSPSEGVLAKGDQVVSVNGSRPKDVTQLRAIIAANGTGKPVSIGISRAGTASMVEVTPVVSKPGAPPVLGISVGTDYSFPFEVKIQLDNVGGPSAGLMFALGIIDKLTPGALTGGASVAGTGTITAEGTVGGIGGIRQKLFGARDGGATVFLAPAANCDEVTGHIPSGLTVFAVSTLAEALSALAVVADGGDFAGVPSCPAG